jgi:hypothetical protein
LLHFEICTWNSWYKIHFVVFSHSIKSNQWDSFIAPLHLPEELLLSNSLSIYLGDKFNTEVQGSKPYCSYSKMLPSKAIIINIVLEKSLLLLQEYTYSYTIVKCTNLFMRVSDNPKIYSLWRVKDICYE